MSTMPATRAAGGNVEIVCAESVTSWLSEAPTSMDWPPVPPPPDLPATWPTPLPYSSMRGSSHPMQ